MSAGFRNAALKLHGLLPADRDWILQQLPAHDRKTLSGLLQELRELGITTDQRVVDEAAQIEARQALLRAGAALDGLPEALDALCAAPASRIAAVLDAEPEQTVVLVLSAYPWPWRARLLADSEVEKRLRLGRALQQMPQLKPRVRAELVKLLADRVAAKGAAAPASGPASAAFMPAPRRSFLQGLRRWLP